MKAIHNLFLDGSVDPMVVSKSKDTSYLKAIHNNLERYYQMNLVVSKSKDTSYLKAIHNLGEHVPGTQKVVSKSKDTSYLKAIHNGHSTAFSGKTKKNLFFQVFDGVKSKKVVFLQSR